MSRNTDWDAVEVMLATTYYVMLPLAPTALFCTAFILLKYDLLYYFRTIHSLESLTLNILISLDVAYLFFSSILLIFAPCCLGLVYLNYMKIHLNNTLYAICWKYHKVNAPITVYCNTLWHFRWNAANEFDLYRQLRILHTFCTVFFKDAAVICIAVGVGIVITFGFLGIRLPVSIFHRMFFLQVSVVSIIALRISIRTFYILMTQSIAFIAASKFQAVSEYKKAISRSLCPIKTKLMIQEVVSPNLFLVLLNKIIINYIITLLVSF